MLAKSIQPLEGILEELSLDDCCSQISDEQMPLPNKVAIIVTLAMRFKEREDLSEANADLVLLSFPDELVAELLSGDDAQLKSYQQLMCSILPTLLAVCSDLVYRQKLGAVELLLEYCEKKKSDVSAAELETIPLFVRPCVEVKAARTISLFGRALSLFGNFMVKNEKELPSRLILTTSHDYVRFIDVAKESDCHPLTAWTLSYRVVLSRILRSSPQRVLDEYRKLAFLLVQDISALCGPVWFQTDSELLCLVSHLVSVQLRIVLDKPDEIDVKELENCMAIAEMCIRCVDGDDDVIDDEAAVVVSKAVREAAVFVMDYWAAAMEIEEKLSEEIQRQLFPFVCCFLAIGGAEIVPKESIDKVVPHMYELARLAVGSKDTRLPRQLISVLELLPSRLPITPEFLVEYIEIDEDRKERGARVEEVLDLVTSIRGSSDWYNRETLAAARKWAKGQPDKRLMEAFSAV